MIPLLAGIVARSDQSLRRPLQVITEALTAFTWLLRFPLPAVEQNAGQLTKQLFVLLKDYSKAGAARGENYLLVQNCFKVGPERSRDPGQKAL